LKEEDKMFVTEIGDKRVWVVDDDSAYTIMFPEDY
jgi:hypothetical protein